MYRAVVTRAVGLETLRPRPTDQGSTLRPKPRKAVVSKTEAARHLWLPISISQ